MNWEELRARAAGYLAAVAADATDAVPHDRFDAAAWRETKIELASVAEMVTEFGKEQDHADDLLADVFNLCMKGDPRIRTRGEMAPSHVANREMVEYLSKLTEFTDLHRWTVGSLYSSAMALLSMWTEIQDAYDRMAAARELAEELQRLVEEVLAAVAVALEAVDQESREEAEAALGEAEEAVEAAGRLREELEATGIGAAALAAMSIRSAARQAAALSQGEAELMAAFGVEDGVLRRMDFATRLALAERLRGTRMAKFAAMIGAFRSMATAESRRRVDTVPSEATGIVLGDDLTRLVPAEFLNLAAPEMEDDFWLRWSERRLLNWRLTGYERQGRGPILVVCDESGSMEIPDLGGVSREAWSKAFALSLCDVAKREGRDFVYIGFSSTKQQWVCDLSGAANTLDNVVEFTEHFFNGGTHYETPLAMALELIEERHAATGLARPDVVFLTDDAYTMPDPGFLERWNATRERVSVRCHGIHLGTATCGALAAIADDVRHVATFMNDIDVVADIFRGTR